MRISIIGLILYLCSVPVFSATFSDNTFNMVTDINDQQHRPAIHPVLLLAGASQNEKSEPESGSLIIPGEDQDKKDKQCLNVCKKWGEDCMTNPRTGARDCRRTCKEFGEECF